MHKARGRTGSWLVGV